MTDDLKKLAAIAALEEIRDGMIVGLGSGSTAWLFIRELARAQLKILGIPTSEESRRIAEETGIRLTTFSDHPTVDVTVDGADEVSPALDLMKGMGGAFVREKIVAHASKRVVIIVDDSKLVEKLGSKTPIPVEVVPLAVPGVLLRLNELGGEARIREKDGKPFVSDNGNVLVHWSHGVIEDPGAMERQLKSLTGVVDSGVFAGVASCVIVAGSSGLRRLYK
jgi:ribose 5-phosphate isomerase A